MKVIPVC